MVGGGELGGCGEPGGVSGGVGGGFLGGDGGGGDGLGLTGLGGGECGGEGGGGGEVGGGGDCRLGSLEMSQAAIPAEKAMSNVKITQQKQTAPH